MDKPLVVLFGCCSKPYCKLSPELETNVLPQTNVGNSMERLFPLHLLLFCLCVLTAYLDLSCFLMDEQLDLYGDISGTRI